MRPTLEWDLSGQCSYDTGDKDTCDVGCEDLSVAPQIGSVKGTVLKRETLADAWSTHSQTCVTYLEGDNYINFGEFRDTCIGNPQLCTNGFTVAFWVKFVHSSNTGDRYILTSGKSGWDGKGFHIMFVNDAETGANLNVGVTGQYNYTIIRG